VLIIDLRCLALCLDACVLTYKKAIVDSLCDRTCELCVVMSFSSVFNPHTHGYTQEQLYLIFVFYDQLYER